jgi:Ca-activated chloride channel family protein
VIPENFHFLRPAWLFALLPVALLIAVALRREHRASAWRRVVDQHLLRHLMLGDGEPARRWPLALAALGLAAACLALASPAWERLPQPTFTATAPTVVALDMSPSMSARDVRPSRLARARHKLHDVLARTRGGQVGLVLYADEPFVAAPLTDDARVIEEMIPTLESGLMPPRPSRADRAIEQAKALLDQAGAASGRILLVTDGIDEQPDSALAAARAVVASGRTLSVLGVGAEPGSRTAQALDTAMDDDAARRAAPALEVAGLEDLAAAGGGRFAALTADDRDLATLLPAAAAGAGDPARAAASVQADVWRDLGVYLLLVPLPLAPFAFRRGLVAALALALLAATPARAEASTWSDLWLRRDQQAQAALEAGDAAGAAALFEDPAWKAAAHYRSGSFEESVKAYQGLPGEENRYNLGNALARSGRLEDAIAAYDEVLAKAPDHGDARFNRDLVQKLLDEQKKQQAQEQGAPSGQQDQDSQGEAQSGGGGAGQPEDGAGRQDLRGQDSQQPEAAPEADSKPGEGDGTASAAEAHGAQPVGEQAQKPEDGAASDAQASAGASTAAEPPSGDDAGEAPERPGDDVAAADRPQEPHGDEPASQAAAAREGARDGEQAKRDRALAEGLDAALEDDASERPPQQEQPHDQPAPATGTTGRPMTEREQAREQALRSIPDDPGGLLRAKIRRRYAEKRYSQREVTSPW